ncbi:fimbrial protein [Hafnia paralvei]|uniref:fimbrial protein n=1 Tax=Hafnia paralvei TaxID=546367 RepID=UPI003CED49AD
MKSMHKAALTVLAISGLSCMMVNNAFASINDSINFTATGSVISNPCQVTVTPTVEFSDLNPADLHVSTTFPVNPQQISISISSCPANTRLNASVVGTTDTRDNRLMALSNSSDSDAAKNVGIGFWLTDQSLLPVSSGVTPDVTTVDSNASVINIMTALALESNSVAPVSGNIVGSANIKINYL